MSLFKRGPELESPNGLLIDGDSLIVAASGSTGPGHLLSIDLKTKKIKKLTPDPLGNLDGLERRDAKTFLVSDWKAGKVFEVNESGEAKVLLEGFKGAADIGFIKETNTLIVPRMMENKISAYQL